MLTAQTQETINEEVQGLDRAYARGGLPILLARSSSSAPRQPGANLYLIADPDGRILTGNVESLEPGVLEVEGWTERPFTYRRFGEGAGDDDAGAIQPRPPTATTRRTPRSRWSSACPTR